MEKIIFGGSTLGEIAYKVLQKTNNGDVIKIYDDGVASSLIVDKVQGGLRELLSKRAGEECEVFIAIGDNEVRRSVAIAVKEAGIQLLNIIDRRAIIEDGLDLGSGNLIMANSYLGTDVKIGDGNIIFPGVCITHHNVVGSFNFFSPNSSVGGFSRIGDFCKIGINSVVSPYMNMLDKTLIEPLSIYR